MLLYAAYRFENKRGTGKESDDQIQDPGRMEDIKLDIYKDESNNQRTTPIH